MLWGNFNFCFFHKKNGLTISPLEFCYAIPRVKWRLVCIGFLVRHCLAKSYFLIFYFIAPYTYIKYILLIELTHFVIFVTQLYKTKNEPLEWLIFKVKTILNYSPINLIKPENPVKSRVLKITLKKLALKGCKSY